MWWWIGRPPPPAPSSSEADELRARKKLLAKELAEKKLAVKKLKRAIKAKRKQSVADQDSIRSVFRIRG